MTTIVYVLGAALVVVAELAFAIAHYDGTALSDRAMRVEDRLDRQLHQWVLHSPCARPADANPAAGDGSAGSAK